MSAAEIIDTAVSEEMTIHPAAEAFPMLPDDELQALAADIKAHGLREPIMLSTDGRQLVDGRNRIAACAIAEVDPRYDWLPQGMDPREYIISKNINRRHLNKGQQALGLALIYPEGGGKGGRGKKDDALKNLPESGRFGRERLREARLIIRHVDLTALVKAGTMKFDMALEEAQLRARIEANSAHYMSELRAHAPDLATQVAEEHLTLQEAWGAYEARKREAELVKQRKHAASLRALEWFLSCTTSSANAEFLQGLEEDLKDPDFEAQVHNSLRLAEIDRGATRLAMVNGAKALTAIMQALL